MFKKPKISTSPVAAVGIMQAENGTVAYENFDHERPTTAVTSEPELHRAHDPYSALRFPPYLFYAIGNFGSVIGRQMLSVAVEWEIYQRTHSAAALGFAGLVLALPTILFAVPAGHAADRFSRKHILIVTQAFTAAASLALALLSFFRADIGWLYAAMFVSGSGRAFGWAARSAFMANLVPPEHLNNAVTWESSTLQIASVIGPAAAGLLLVRVGFPVVYALNMLTAILFFTLLWQIPTRPSAPRRKAARAGLRELFSGFHFVWKTKIVLAAITLDLFAILFGGATALLPLYADSLLHVGALGLGWMRAAPAIGAVSMGLALAHLPPLRRPGKALLWAVTGFGLATITFGISRSFWLSMLALLLTGALDNVSVVVRHTLVQLLTPDSMRGRVSAVNNIFSGSSNQLGAFESGMAAAWFGPAASVVSGGVMTIFVVGAIAALWPAIARLGSFAALEPEKFIEGEYLANNPS